MLIDVVEMSSFVGYKDLVKHLDTDSGKELFAKSATFYKLNKGEVLWIPYGSIPMPFGNSDDEYDHACEDEDEDEDDDND